MAMILTAFVPQLIQTLHNLAEEEMILKMGISEEIRGLLKRMETVRGILPDAESKSQRGRVIHHWVSDLKQIIYEIDDIVDQCKIELHKHKTLSEAADFTTKCRISLFFCFSSAAIHPEIGNRIKSVNVRLEGIVKEASKLQLTPIDQANEVRLICTDITISDSNAVGVQIEEDIKKMVKLLIKDDQKIFFAITGIGGIGKTTLAQKIHDDERIKAHFHIRIWICVSQQFNDINILKQIISGAGGTYGEAQTREQLEHIARRNLQHKRFFLVLDDVWSYHVCVGLWQSSLRDNVVGSRILITTRSEAIARELNDVHHHRMKLLPTTDGWSLLSNKVFHGGQCDQELTNVGLSIVRKCKGLPLAINTVAGVLRSKRRSHKEWHKVFVDPAWSSPDLPNNIMRALFLGYQDLPSHVKQCFVYCSLFPMDYVFVRSVIVQHWIAEGLVEVKENFRTEDTAEGYYNELVCRNLLDPLDCRLSDRCKMHGLLRYLAYFVAAEENLVGSSSSLNAPSTKTRRLSIASKCLRSIPSEITRQEFLRTLLLFKNPLRIIAPDIFQGMRCLRVLDIHGTEIEILPSSIVNLRHLRHLNVSETKLRRLPDNIDQLSNLLFMSVRGCESLRSLPNSLVKLQSLRSLDLLGTRIDRMPIGSGKLENLSTLLGFVVDEGNEGSRFEFDAMIQLNHISLQKLERVSNGTEAAKARLRSKLYLKTLALNWSRQIKELHPQDMDKFKEVLEELAPPPSLEVLEIRGFTGIENPSWITSVASPLTNLTQLAIQQCSFIQQLPQLGHLPRLNHLYISAATAVTTIGNEFLGLDADPPFPSLITLIIEDLPNWEDWQWQIEDGEAFPCLRELRLANCPKLGSLPGGLQRATTLISLSIDGADSITRIQELPSVKQLDVHHCCMLMDLHDLVSIESLKIRNCPSLKMIANLHSLKHLQLIDSSIGRLPEGLEGAAMKGLEWLEIEGSEELVRKCLKGGSEWAKLRHMADVHVRTTDASMYASYCWDEPQIRETDIQGSEASLHELQIVPANSVAAHVDFLCNSIMQRFGQDEPPPFLRPSQKLLILLGVSLITSALLDYLIFSVEASVVSSQVDVVPVFVAVPLSIARDVFGFLSYACFKAYQVIEQLENGVDFVSFNFGSRLESSLHYALSRPSSIFAFVLLTFLAFWGEWFRH